MFKKIYVWIVFKILGISRKDFNHKGKHTWADYWEKDVGNCRVCVRCGKIAL